jgi:hypothetical protein
MTAIVLGSRRSRRAILGLRPVALSIEIDLVID